MIDFSSMHYPLQQNTNAQCNGCWIPINVFYLFLAGFTEIELQNTVYCLWNLILYWWKHPRKEERREKHLICLGDHPCTMSAKRWVGGGQKNCNFSWFSVLFMLTLTLVGGSRKGQKYADVIYGRSLGLASVPTA